ncbi:MAG: type VI secretion system contractile sheath small subunit [Salinisphaeraceae bacterium]|jgi:type VI secretion system protein ImpB|nr:type VI secretion system contractile sheath small subunit [Salinisphaeraceae bacterium]
MAKSNSIQKRLEKVRPPRVQLTYDIEKGDAIEQKELPFVLGALSDLRGQSDKPQPKLRDRKFVNCDMDNFDDVMRGLAPRARFNVPNRLTDEEGEVHVELAFNSMDDFRPESVAEQFEPLRRLVEARRRLAELRNKLVSNDKLEDALADALNNSDQLDSRRDDRDDA